MLALCQALLSGSFVEVLVEPFVDEDVLALALELEAGAGLGMVFFLPPEAVDDVSGSVFDRKIDGTSECRRKDLLDVILGMGPTRPVDF